MSRQPSSSEARGGTTRPRESTALRSKTCKAQPERELGSASGRLRTKAHRDRARRPPRSRTSQRSAVPHRCGRVLRARSAAGRARRSLRVRGKIAPRAMRTPHGRVAPPAAPLGGLARAIGGGRGAQRATPTYSRMMAFPLFAARAGRGAGQSRRGPVAAGGVVFLLVLACLFVLVRVDL